VVKGAIPPPRSWPPERERIVVDQRFGLHGPERTLAELGTVLGLSAERVRQIEQCALRKLRAAVAA
jgi:RNA polymerase primary sigma factor